MFESNCQKLSKAASVSSVSSDLSSRQFAMNDADDVLTNIYDTLLHMRYPHITNAESRNVETTILTGENRICLLSWLLTERSPIIAADLAKLKDAALEGQNKSCKTILRILDQLFEYYSQIGMCNNKDILLGKCSLKEQLSLLRLLLDFMKKVHVDSPTTSTSETEEADTFADIIKPCSDDKALPLSTFKSKINYAEATKYFEQMEKELPSNVCEDIRNHSIQDLHMETDNRLDNEEQSALFVKEIEKFAEIFQTISSWPVPRRNLDKNTADSVCSYIESVCSDFSALKKILRARDEIANISIAKGLPRTNTPLNSIIEDIVIYNEELANLNMTDISDD